MLCANGSYQQLVNTRPLSEAVTEEELTKLKKNVKGDAEAVETKVRVKIQQQLGLVYQKTQEATNARWVYESEVPFMPNVRSNGRTSM